MKSFKYQKSKTDKIVLTVFIGIIMGVLIQFGLIISLLEGLKSFCICASIITALIFLIFQIWGMLKPKIRYIIFGAVALIFLSVSFIITAVENYHDNIGTVSTRVNLWEYEPFREDTKAVFLDEESTLKLSEDLPRLDGATALYPVYSAFVQTVYPRATRYLEAEGIFKCSTTAYAYENLLKGETDIIFVAGSSEEHLKAAQEAGLEMVFTPIGRDALVFFVNSKNAVSELSSEQIRRIYAGEITDWSELRKKKGEITAYQREENSGSQTAFIGFMNGTPITPPITEKVSEMSGMVERVADYKNYNNAIGYSFLFFTTEMVNNNKIKLLSIDGVEPTRENVANGTYPLSDYFYAVTLKGNENPNVDIFIEWILSEQGQYLIEKTGYTRLINP
ncbi:MAG: substrate-binding domain-containing protein [Oscillospiraceae bacterium]|nr:substrate-binding domain-containing protein [Oscillospiraceae bacterium]